MIATLRVCPGCGDPLPENAHRNRRWCSERCRKASYGQPCVDCGARTSHGAESAHIQEPRCGPCARIVLHEEALERNSRIESMWEAGLTLRAIAEAMGWKGGGHAAGARIARLRAIGYDLPYRNLGAFAYAREHGARGMALARAARKDRAA